jgi:hypothetical protein
MDPNANVVEAVALARRLLSGRMYVIPGTRALDVHAMVDDAERLAELVVALDEWRSRGGFDNYLTS